MEHVDWVNLIWLDEVPPAKPLVIWKLLYDLFPIDLKVQEKGMILCYVFFVW